MVPLRVLLPEAGTQCVSFESSSNAKDPTFALESPVVVDNVYLGTSLPLLSTTTQLESPDLKSQRQPRAASPPSHTLHTLTHSHHTLKPLNDGRVR